MELGLGLPNLRDFAIYASHMCDEVNVHQIVHTMLDEHGDRATPFSFIYHEDAPNEVRVRVRFEADGKKVDHIRTICIAKTPVFDEQEMRNAIQEAWAA